MLMVSFAVLTAAAGLGAVLASLVLRETRRPSWRVGAVHGISGAFGLLLLVLSLRGPARGAADGAALFGWDAAALIGAALLVGIALLIWRRKQGLLVALHAVLAVFGYVVLASYVSF